MSPTTDMHRPISLLICALGGEGGGVLTEWLVETARIAGFPAQATSIPGVAQRTGATTYYVEVFPQPLRVLGKRMPVFSLNPVPGALDGMISSELLETARQITNGLPSPDRTLLITSSARTFTTQERMQQADGRADSADLLTLVREFSREHHVLDMAALARDSGTVVSAVMLGALAASGLFPFSRAQYETVVRNSGGSAEASLRGFEAAWNQVKAARQQTSFVQQLLQESEQETETASGLPADWEAKFPAVALPVLALGHARLCDYQGRAYATRYLERMGHVLAAEQLADPQAVHGHAITVETARWLALWMAYDDIIRVADLKSRASRLQRVTQETRAAEHDLLKVYDHFKPGVPEVAGLLPTGLARRLLAWDARRVARGQQPWALPLKIGTHTVLGMLALRLLASMRCMRPMGSRFAAERDMIRQWLAALIDGTRRDWRLGHEIAQCGRLIKGYGATNERGKDNLLHVLQHLAHGPDAPAAAQAVAAARQAALADDAGRALDATLRQHGAPARPVKEHPIRWVRKPGAGTA